MNLILVSPQEIGERGEVELGGRRAAHIRDVLQGRPGQSLRVGQVNGPLGTGMIKTVGAQVVTLRCVFGSDIPPVPRVDLLLALPRPKAMKRLWAPLASLGVGHVILTNAQKVERFYFDSHVLDESFYTNQLYEGLEQAQDTRLPQVRIARQFKPLMEDDLAVLLPNRLRLVADPEADLRVADAVGASAFPRVLLAVGPEGGWSGYELDLMRAHGFIRVGMGSRTLRTDTACIALLSLIQDALASTGHGPDSDPTP